MDHIALTAGLVYYVTVTCCNTADLCTTVTSDGVTVDPSPPTPGRVLDGNEAIDIQYQAMRFVVNLSNHPSLGQQIYKMWDP